MPPLEWQPMVSGSRGYYSACKRYSVCSAGPEDNAEWQAWKLAPGGPWFAPLALGLPSEQAARESAEKDAEKTGSISCDSSRNR